MAKSLTLPEKWHLTLEGWQSAVQRRATACEATVARLAWMYTATNALALVGSVIGCVASVVALFYGEIGASLSIAGCGIATTAIAAQITFFPLSRLTYNSTFASRYSDLSRRIDIEKMRVPKSVADAHDRLSDIAYEFAILDQNATGVLGVQRPVPDNFNWATAVHEIALAPGNTAVAGLGCGLWSFVEATSAIQSET